MPWNLVDGTLVAVPPVAEAPVDPYGVDIALDATGDWLVSSSGSLGTVGGPYNAAQAIFMRLETQQGDLALHPEYGSQIPRRMIGSKKNLAGVVAQLNAELRNMLTEDPRFASAKIVQAYTGEDSITLGVQATLAGGEQLTLDGTSDPAPADVQTPQIVDPTSDPTLLYDPMSEAEFFADQSELDTLNDLDQLASLVSDLTPGG